MEKRIDNIRLRVFKSHEWFDPKQVLINLRYVETNLLSPDMDEKVRRLRTNELKELRELRDAAIFAYGLQTQILKVPVVIANVERSDYDFVVWWVKEENEYFYPVQLKELPPGDLNTTASLDGIYNIVVEKKYSGADDLAVAIRINKNMTLKCGPWEKDKRPHVRELWLFGNTSPDQSKWYICGDILKKPLLYEFMYPEGKPPLLNHLL